MKLTIFGSGTSQGVPVLGCGCPVCRSADSRDMRTRASLFVSGPDGGQAVIDTGPEFRIQGLRSGLCGLDAVFLTHAHADHLHGIDDIRPLNRDRPVPVYGNAQTIAEFRERFSYIFRKTQCGGGKPQVEPHSAVPGQNIRVKSLVFTPVPVIHGSLGIFGWIISSGAACAVYITDVSYIPDDSFRIIENARPSLAIIGALRRRPHETHFTFEQALEAAVKTGVRRVYLTHICHEHTHQEIETICCTFSRERAPFLQAEPARDGLEITLPDSQAQMQGC